MAQQRKSFRRSNSTTTGTWSEAFCQPRIFLTIFCDLSAPFRPGLVQT